MPGQGRPGLSVRGAAPLPVQKPRTRLVIGTGATADAFRVFILMAKMTEQAPTIRLRIAFGVWHGRRSLDQFVIAYFRTSSLETVLAEGDGEPGV